MYNINSIHVHEFTCIVVKFRFEKKILSYLKNYFVIIKIFLLKKINKAALLYLFNIFILSNTVLSLN